MLKAIFIPLLLSSLIVYCSDQINIDQFFQEALKSEQALNNLKLTLANLINTNSVNVGKIKIWMVSLAKYRGDGTNQNYGKIESLLFRAVEYIKYKEEKEARNDKELLTFEQYCNINSIFSRIF